MPPSDHNLTTVTMVTALLRNGRGGSPTAVIVDQALTDEQCHAMPGLMGTSHLVVVNTTDNPAVRDAVSLRFFTSVAELPACGHGTVAALAVLYERFGAGQFEATLQSMHRAFVGTATRAGDGIEAAFDPGSVQLRDPAMSDLAPILAGLRLPAESLPINAVVGSTGRERALIQIAGRSELDNLRPDAVSLRSACDRVGLLGCYVYCEARTDRFAARMFAPSIGVAEDIANANSTACLAVHRARRGRRDVDIAVEMGDSLGRPATIRAAVHGTDSDPVVRVGGRARIIESVELPLPVLAN